MINQVGTMMAQGRNIASERIQGVNDNMSKSHYHDYLELYYLEERERYHIIQGRLYCIHPGEFFVFSPYVMHHPYDQKNVLFKRLLAYFSREEVDSEQLLKALEWGTGIYKPNHQKRQMVHRMLDGLLKEQEGPQAYHEDYTHILLNMISLTIIRKIQTPVKPEQRSRIADVISYTHQNYQEDVSIDQLTQIPYISSYYLCKEFRQYTNSTIIQCVDATGVVNTQRTLIETDRNITGISRDTGFSSTTCFNRASESVVGMTPSSFRKMYRTEAGYCRGTF